MFTNRKNRRNANKFKKQSEMQKLKKEVKQLKKVATPEVKYIDTDVTNADVGTSLEVQCITLVSQGDTDENRDGDSILIKNIYIKGVLHHVHDTGGTVFDPALVRCILVEDREQDGNGSVFTITDFLDSDNLESYYQSSSNQRRFIVHYDKVHSIGYTVVNATSGYGAAQGMNKKWVQISKKLNKKIYYNGTASTQASAGRGKLYWCLIKDNIGANGTVSFNGNSRVTFQDV